MFDVSAWTLSDFAAAVTAVAAVVALVFGIWQVRASEASSREATAKQIWMNYELRGFEEPRFANPSIADIDYKARSFIGDAEQFLKYEWFVSFMLLACEEVLRLGGKDWENGVDDNLLSHWPYLGGPLFAPYLKNMSAMMRRRLDHVGRLAQRAAKS
jgi:hypothetical protein